MDSILHMQNMTDNERLLFQNEVIANSKSVTAGVVLAFFLGGFGAHHYYMGNIGLGVLYTLLCWTLIPGFVALIECFLMPGRVRKYNLMQAENAALKIRAVRPNQMLPNAA